MCCAKLDLTSSTQTTQTTILSKKYKLQCCSLVHQQCVGGTLQDGLLFSNCAILSFHLFLKW